MDLGGAQLPRGTRPGQQNMNTVLKELRKEQNGMWSCLNSLLEDSSFVAELRWASPRVYVALQQPDLPAGSAARRSARGVIHRRHVRRCAPPRAVVGGSYTARTGRPRCLAPRRAPRAAGPTIEAPRRRSQ